MTDLNDSLVLHVRVVTGAGGGPEKTILNSPKFLRPLGYDAVCAYLHPPGDPGFEKLRARAADNHAEIVSIPDSGLTDFSVVSRLIQLCRERKIRIWHGHDYKSNALGLLVQKFHPMRLVTTVHGWVFSSQKTNLYYAVDRACLKHYERVVCVSEDLLAQCLATKVPIQNCALIENAIDLDAYQVTTDKAAAKRELGLPVDRMAVGALGRLSPEKGFDVLIRAVDQAIEAGTPMSLVIAGEGPCQAELEQLIRDLGRQDHIRLLGHLSDAQRVFNALDVFVLSSRMEGLPNVLLEAFACGVATIATPVGGVAHVLADEENGLLVPVDDVGAMTVALTRVLNNDALRQSLGKAGRKTVEARFSFRFRMQKMVALYDELLGRPVRLFESHGGDADAAGETPAGQAPDSYEPELLSGDDANVDGAVLLARSTRVSLKPAITLQRATVKVELTASPSGWQDYLAAKGHQGFYQQAQWLRVLEQGLQHQPACLQAVEGQKLVGVLPMALVASPIFGRFLVSLPYVNSSGIVADSPEAEFALVDRAVQLADQLKVRYLELRHERAVEHPRLVQAVTDKVHMRLALPSTSSALWDGIKSKVRNQIRKAQKNEELSVVWGGLDVLDEFYDVFCRNMRDLGTPPFNRKLFSSLIEQFAATSAAEFCCVRLRGQPVASGLLVHGPGVTEVPSASSLRQFNATNCNMLLYWSLLSRAIERGQQTFDFGRSSRDSGTYAFKAQWGATESPAVWQHYVREGDARDMRPNNGKFDLVISTWQKLPVWLTKLVGPTIVRGIP